MNFKATTISEAVEYAKTIKPREYKAKLDRLLLTEKHYTYNNPPITSSTYTKVTSHPANAVIDPKTISQTDRPVSSYDEARYILKTTSDSMKTIERSPKGSGRKMPRERTVNISRLSDRHLVTWP